jgi:hypothetical protein
VSRDRATCLFALRWWLRRSWARHALGVIVLAACARDDLDALRDDYHRRSATLTAEQRLAFHARTRHLTEVYVEFYQRPRHLWLWSALVSCEVDRVAAMYPVPPDENFLYGDWAHVAALDLIGYVPYLAPPSDPAVSMPLNGAEPLPTDETRCAVAAARRDSIVAREPPQILRPLRSR